MNGSFFSQVSAAQVDQSLHRRAPQPNPERGRPLLQEGFDALTDHQLRFLDDVRRIEPRPEVILHVCLNQSSQIVTMEIEQLSERILVASSRSLQQVVGHGGFTVFHVAHRFPTAWLANRTVRLMDDIRGKWAGLEFTIHSQADSSWAAGILCRRQRTPPFH